MKINRYDVPAHPLDHDKPNNVFGQWCRAMDVAKLEASCAELEAKCAELLEALEYAVNIYGRFGAVVNEPHNPGEWIELARAAIAKAKGEGV